eukprot:m.17755 g.17755  ORF g.17755 m.17755 type:complete len:54 (-) comp7550_c0_seq2:999-1160(-)
MITTTPKKPPSERWVPQLASMYNNTNMKQHNPHLLQPPQICKRAFVTHAYTVR